MASWNIQAMRSEFPGKPDAEAARDFARRHAAIAVVRYKSSKGASDFTDIGLCKEEREVDGYLDSPYCYDAELLYDSNAENKALLRAARRNAPNDIQRVIQNGANVNYRESETGGTPINWAAHRGNLEAVKILLGNKADPDLANYAGSSPLMEASGEGHIEIVKALIAGGANIRAKDNSGGTAFDRARNHPEIQKLLRRALATKEHAAQASVPSSRGSKSWWRFW